VLILGKNGHLFRLAVEQPLAFFPRGCRGPHPKALAAELDRRILNFQQWQQDAALVDAPSTEDEITLKPPIYVVTGY
jgi:hypothetical protein